VLIAAGTVELWVVSLANASASEDERLLDDAERTRAAQLAFERDRRRFVAAHAALRRVLAPYTGLTPAALRFSTEHSGKPRIAGEAGERLGWNLSHSGDMALVAVAGGPVGVDIECTRPLDDLAGLAERCLTAAETRELASAAEPARVRAFLSGWTRKEACLKTVGAGLALDPRCLQVGLGPEERLVQFAWEGRAHRLVVRSVECARDTLAAVALLAPAGDVPLVVRQCPAGLLPAA
jgi:4'-phosphopantetheinyl transferase